MSLSATIDAVGSLSALTLALVFALAAVTKLLAPGRTAEEFAALDLPRPAAAARIVPPIELALAAGLLLRPALAAPAALALLVAFTAVLARVVRSGRSVTCGCLGPLSRRPVTGRTLARNGLLMALAVLVMAASATSDATPALPDPALLVAGGTAAALVGLVAQLWLLRAQIGRLWSVELAGEGRRLTAGPLGPTTTDPTRLDPARTTKGPQT